MLSSPLSLLIFWTGIIVCGAALTLGSTRERLGALYYLLALAFSIGLKLWTPFAAPIRFLLVDGAVLLGLLTLCWKAPHPWPLWGVGLQMLAVAADLTAATTQGVLLWTILTIVNACGYLLLLCLFVGTLAAMRARRTASKKSSG